MHRDLAVMAAVRDSHGVYRPFADTERLLRIHDEFTECSTQDPPLDHVNTGFEQERRHERGQPGTLVAEPLNRWTRLQTNSPQIHGPWTQADVHV